MLNQCVRSGRTKSTIPLHYNHKFKLYIQVRAVPFKSVGGGGTESFLRGRGAEF